MAAVTHSAPWRSTISVFDPTTSWSAKWLRLGAWLPDAALPVLLALRHASLAERQAPGCYALSVTDKIPASLLERMAEE